MTTAVRWLLRGAIALGVLLLLAVCAIYALRTWLLPDLTVLQPRIEAKLSETLKQAVHLNGLSAAWNGANVDIRVQGVSIGDANAPVLRAANIQATISAYPLLWGKLHTQSLNLASLTLLAEQDGSPAAPHWRVAGVDLSAPSDGAALRWALAQPMLTVEQLEVQLRDRAAYWVPESNVNAQFNKLVMSSSGLNHLLSGQFAPDYRDARLGEGVRLNVDFSHALIGDSAQVSNWTGAATLSAPSAHIARTGAWLLPLLGKAGAPQSAQSQAWLRWAKQSLSQATLASNTVLRFKQGALSAKGTATVNGLARQNEAIFAPFDWSWSGNTALSQHALELRSSKLALAPLARLLETMPVSTDIRNALNQAQAQGHLSELQASAAVSDGALSAARLSAQATQLGLRSFDWAGDKGIVNIPALDGMTGTFKINYTPLQTDTHISLNTQKAAADFPRLFEQPRIEFESLLGEVDIKLTRQQVTVSLNKLRFSNADLAGELSGQYTVAAKQSAADTALGLAQLSGSFARAELSQLHRYMPLTLPVNAREWLRHTISQGQATGLQMTLNGELSRFPFLPNVAQAGERFDLSARIDQAVLNFNPPSAITQSVPSTDKPWPQINAVSGELTLHGLSLGLQQMEGTLQALGPTLAQTPNDKTIVKPRDTPIAIRVPKLTIASLTQPVVVFQTRATAGAASLLDLVRNTPLSESYADQLAALKASGEVNVDANLVLDIGSPDNNQAQGSFKLQNAAVQIINELPPIEQINATVAFKQSSLRIEQASAQWFGGSLIASGGYDTKDPSQTLKAQGTAQLAAIKDFTPSAMLQALLSHASGAVDYTLSVSAKPEGYNWQVLGDLNDTALKWPGLLDKAAGVPLAFSLTRKPTLRTVNAGLAHSSQISHDTWEATLGASLLGPFKATIERQLDAGQWRMLRGAVALGAQAELNAPDEGLGVHIVTGKVNLDALRKEIESLPWRKLPASSANSNAGAASAAPPAWMPSVIALQVDDLTVLNRHFYNIVAAAVRSGAAGEMWNANLAAKGINGYVNWVDNTAVEGFGGGQLIAKLTELTIPASEVESASKELLSLSPKQVPSVDLSIASLTLGDKFLGAVNLKASNLAQRSDALGWDIEQLGLILPHAKLSAKGAWTQFAGSPQGQVKLTLDLATDSLGDTLDALGYGKLVAGAAGTIMGDVAWQGTPFNIDIASLSGQLQADFSKGQFLKVDPGAGRLVGLFSLQNLPRRLTLDFKDMFGTGFAFDSMKASAKIDQGLLKTDDFMMASSAAEVSAKGEVSLSQETQSLVFSVKPNFDAGSVSLLYMIINPPLGLATLAAQYLLREPLRQSLTVEYAITGSWAKPDTQQIKREIK